MINQFNHPVRWMSSWDFGLTDTQTHAHIMFMKDLNGLQPLTTLSSGAIRVPRITKEKLIGVLWKKSCNSAPGPDHLPYLVFKKGIHFPELISVLFNRILDECEFPNSWKQGSIVLIHKKDDPANPKNLKTSVRSV